MPNTVQQLFVAYTVVWVLIIGYIVSLSSRLSHLEKKLQDD